jgi:ankyrin repeat protein
MQDPQSAILTALYHRQPDEAERLAGEATTLTVWEAAALGREDALAALLDGDPSLVNAFSPDGFMPLGLAAFFGRTSAVEALLGRGADVHAVARNDMRVQPLHAAVAARSADVVALLLDRGADPNARQQVGYTPLMGAAGAGRTELVNLLLARGADPTLAADDGKTAASCARDHGHHELADRLTTQAT